MLEDLKEVKNAIQKFIDKYETTVNINYQITTEIVDEKEVQKREVVVTANLKV